MKGFFGKLGIGDSRTIKSKGEIQKTIPKHFRSLSWVEKGGMIASFFHASLCRIFGKEPSAPANTAYAVEKWILWLRKNEKSLPPVHGHILVLALYSYGWIEWAFYAACWMRRLGLAPVVLYSLKDIHRLYGKPGKQSLKDKIRYGVFWKHLDRIPDVVSINVDEMPEPSSDSLSRFGDYADRQAHTNAAYKLFVEEHEQGPMKEEYDRLVEEIRGPMLKETAQAYELLPKLSSKYGVERILGFSGIVDRSACYESAASEAGFPRVWVEGWSILPGLMRYNMNKPALDFDAKDWIDALEWNAEEQAEMERFLVFQETNEGDESEKEKLRNHIRYQIVGKEAEWSAELTRFMGKDDRPLFLLATNVVGDSATFQRQTIFESQRSWISEVVDYFKIHPDKRLIIRAHPSERVYELNGQLKVNLGQIAAKVAAGVENIYVVQWQDPVNTYSLIPHCRAGLTWVSNTGVDMVIRNVPTISAASPIYGGLGITEEPSSKEEYFSRIKQLGKHEEQPEFEQKEMAGKFLYVIYKKIGFLAHGPRYRARGLLLDHSLTSEYACFYRTIAGIE